MANRFIDAAKDGYIDLLHSATRKDLNTPDDDGMTATHWAARNGKLEALRLIVGREGDVNKSDYLGMTPLHHAVFMGHLNVVSYLVNWGCNVYAIDNDSFSALQLAETKNRTDIVRFLDADLGARLRKNPRQVSRQKEEAMRVAEANCKRFQKMQEAAAKRAEKEHKLKELRQNPSNYSSNGEKKKSFFKTLTLRIKKDKIVTSDNTERTAYSAMTGHTYAKGAKTTIAKKMRSHETTRDVGKGTNDFRVSKVDADGNRTVKSLSAEYGLMGPNPDVMYVTTRDGESRRPMLTDVFDNNKMYRSKSESDILDSGVDSVIDDGEEDEEDSPRMLNRPAFGKIGFSLATSFLDTIQSMGEPEWPRRLSGDDQEVLDIADDPTSTPAAHPTVPGDWDQDVLGNLDDDITTGKLSVMEMFLWSCGLVSYFHIFSKEQIDMALLVDMKDAEFIELGLPFGPRKKLREAIARRKTVLEAPSALTDSRL